MSPCSSWYSGRRHIPSSAREGSECRRTVAQDAAGLRDGGGDEPGVGGGGAVDGGVPVDRHRIQRDQRGCAHAQPDRSQRAPSGSIAVGLSPVGLSRETMDSDMHDAVKLLGWHCTLDTGCRLGFS